MVCDNKILKVDFFLLDLLCILFSSCYPFFRRERVGLIISHLPEHPRLWPRGEEQKAIKKLEKLKLILVSCWSNKISGTCCATASAWFPSLREAAPGGGARTGEEGERGGQRRAHDCGVVLNWLRVEGWRAEVLQDV